MRNGFSLFELAQLPEDEAALRRYDARNLTVARWFLRGFAVTALVELIVSLAGPGKTLVPRLPVAVAEFLLAAGFAVFLRRHWRPDPPRRLRPAILGFLAAGLALLLLYSGGREEAFPWLLIMPWASVFLCLKTAERLMLHAYFVAAACVVGLLSAPPSEGGSGSAFWVSALLMNIFPLGASLFLTRRVRRDFLEQWRDLREHAQEQDRMREELEDARDVQLSMLPNGAPAAAGLDFAAMSVPATEVGGDFFGYFLTGSGGFAVVAADVAGHGLASGMVLSGIRSGLTLLSDDLDSPGDVLKRMHRMVRATNHRRMLVTLSVLLFDRSRRWAVVANAGHPPVLHRRAENGLVEEVTAESLPLGAGLAKEFPERRVSIVPGDVFLLHSDGAYETLNGAEEPYGFERLRESLARAGGAGGAAEIRDAVLGDLRTFRGSAPQRDDLTLIVVRVDDVARNS